MRKTTTLLFGLPAALLATAGIATGAGPGTTRLVDVPTGFAAPFDGVNDSSVGQNRAISANGRYVVFTSSSDGLVAGGADDNATHCYRRDLQTGQTVLVDRASGPDGPISSAGCGQVTISPDGSAVAYESSASNLVPDDPPDTQDVFVRMVDAGVTFRASVDSAGTGVNGAMFGISLTVTPAVNVVAGPTVHVVFATDATLDPADPPAQKRFDVYIHRAHPFTTSVLTQNPTFLISRGNGPASPASTGSQPSVSADGNRVAFMTDASLDAADTGADLDVYLRDINAATTTLVSRPDGTTGEAGPSSYSPVISDDGTSVAFESNSPNVDDDGGPDANGTRPDVYVRRLAANETVTVSEASGTTTTRGNGENLRPSISTDGNRVAFLSTSTNLGDGSTTTVGDIHVRDLVTNLTTWASRGDGTNGAAPRLGDGYGWLSGDGGTVLFGAAGDALAPGAGGDAGQAFVRTLASSTTRLASRPTGSDTAPFAQLVGGAQLAYDTGDVSGGGWASRSVSADGRYVAFASGSDALLPAGGSPATQVFRRDMVTGQTVLVSHTATGAPGDDNSGEPVISADGSAVAFTTNAPNLDATVPQVLVWRAGAPAPVMVSVTPAATPGNKKSYHPSISDDGTRVAFESQATDLGPVNPGRSAWWRDLTTGTTRLASRADGANGAQANADVFDPAISGDGRVVGFGTTATNLGDGDTTAVYDVHERDMAAGTTTWVSRADGSGAPGNGSSFAPSLSTDGGTVAFISGATNLAPGDTDTVLDVLVRRVAAGRTLLASRATGAAGDKSTSEAAYPLISGDGSRVMFAGDAPNLAGDDVNGVDDVFVRDLGASTTVGVSRADGAGGGLLGADPISGIAGNASLQCVAFVSGQPALVPGGYVSRDYKHVYLRTVAGDCAGTATGGPAGGPGGGATGGPHRVGLSAVSLKPRRFRPGTARGRGATLRLTLDHAAVVLVTVQRRATGRRVRGTCRATAHTGKRCTRWVTVGTLRLTLGAGARSVRFSGVLRRRPLPAGAYRARLAAGASGLLTSPTRTVTFTALPLR
ncbi:MAG: hypothetical protein U0Y82_09870 [Thermoleophilia bacterium]